MQDMIQAMVIVHTLHGSNITRITYNADLPVAAVCIGAYAAQLACRKVPAALAIADGFSPLPQGCGQRMYLLQREADDVICQTLGSFLTDTGQPCKL